MPEQAAAVAGIGATPLYRRGQSNQSALRLACTAILAALDDAGLGTSDVDGFSLSAVDRHGAGLVDPPLLVRSLGIGQVSFSGSVSGGGGGAPAAVGLAAAAVTSGMADVVVCV